MTEQELTRLAFFVNAVVHDPAATPRLATMTREHGRPPEFGAAVDAIAREHARLVADGVRLAPYGRDLWRVVDALGLHSSVAEREAANALARELERNGVAR